MLIRSSLLYCLGAGLLLFGNRQYFEKVDLHFKEQAAKRKESEANKNLESRFETQKLIFNEQNQQWENPATDFQSIRLGRDIKFNPKAPTSGVKTTIEGDIAEEAGDSA